jgi:hypothetical protein
MFVATFQHHPTVSSALALFYGLHPDHTTHTVALVTGYLTTQLPLIRSLSNPLVGAGGGGGVIGGVVDGGPGLPPPPPHL